ncbi:MAG: hypothetical protein BWY95_00134 [Bacteroidetes bacterium ADurb.BinA104]|jgi:hypothetical protein|nr:MAG: hypothetical protein BWY95_00134 [Bacteroidetes bacterium ADurb.BinA104]
MTDLTELETMQIVQPAHRLFYAWVNDWNKFAADVMQVSLDPQQQEILYAVQTQSRVAVASGTARGKDYVAAVAALCFMYLTPRFNDKNELIANTKVALTAPTGRQVANIMYPEIVRLYNKAGCFPGRLVAFDIRTEYDEWFLTGFKADEHRHEAWSGFHAVNTMFVVTEASGIDDGTFSAIEGNLQANSKLLIVFNPNRMIGYAAKAMFSPRFKSFRLDDLNAPNVLQKRQVYAGQVDYEWVKDKVEAWCTPIRQEDFSEEKGDFKWEGGLYRPNDTFRVKVRGMFPEVSEDALIPYLWIEMANKRWEAQKNENRTGYRKIGVDIAGMGRDSTVFVHRFDDFVTQIDMFQSGGEADHMKSAGRLMQYSKGKVEYLIDTIGEGAGVYSRLIELGMLTKAFSCKASHSAKGLTDLTGEYSFANMRAYMFWALRDWLNPQFNSKACLPPNQLLTQELIEIQYQVQSNGSIIIEAKEKIKERLGRSPDISDALANTFFPVKLQKGLPISQISGMLP